MNLGHELHVQQIAPLEAMAAETPVKGRGAAAGRDYANAWGVGAELEERTARRGGGLALVAPLAGRGDGRGHSTVGDARRAAQQRDLLGRFAEAQLAQDLAEVHERRGRQRRRQRLPATHRQVVGVQLQPDAPVGPSAPAQLARDHGD